MIDHNAYFKGRDTEFACDLAPEILANSKETIRRVNLLLERFYRANPNARRRGCNSGWRPPAVNACTPGAAPMSKHMLALACDIEDIDGQLDEWLMTHNGQVALVEIGLWMEHPNDTPRWTHVQTVSPSSGRRVFYSR